LPFDLPFEFDVFVDDQRKYDSKNGIVPFYNKHDEQTQEQAQQGQCPMIVLVSWSPTWCFEQCLQSTSHVHETVAHQEEHGNQWSQVINVAK